MSIPLWRDRRRTPDERVDALLAEMSLAEQVGQLGSFWPREASAEGTTVAPMESSKPAALSFEDSIANGLGHLTRVFGSGPVEPATGSARLAELQRTVMSANRFGIPAVAHEECLTGFTTLGATVYPAAIAWGATFDPDLVREMASAIGRDLRAVGIHQGLSPLLDVVRDYRWGRCEETCGEDPYLVGTLGTAYVQGLQASGVLACPKHFVAYSASRGGRNHAPVPIGRRELEEMLLPPFEMAVREGAAASVMNAYSDIDGEPAAASRELFTHVLRERWGFSGSVLSDYWSVPFLESKHRVAGSPEEAAALAVHAGLDVELPETICYHHLTDAVQRGLIGADEVRVSARRILLQKCALGLLDDGWEPAPVTDVELDPPANRELARRLAEQSIVLLHNDAGVLPLAADIGTVALVGPIAEDALTFLGCYSFPNHVLTQYPDRGVGLGLPSLAEALVSELAGSTVHVERGVGITETEASGLAAAVDAAARSDVAVVAVGDRAGLFGAGTSGEGCDVVDLRLPGIQGRLVEEVLATGTPTVLLVVSGRPYALGAYADRCAAVIQAFMPGEEGGPAVAGVLSGRVNPSGRLPVAIPAHPGGQPGTYLVPPLGWYAEGASNLDPRPRFPFGHGIGYTTFSLDRLSVEEEVVPTDGSITVSVRVTNTGDRDGAEVVQLYVADPVAQVTRPLKQLVGYTKLWLPAGASRDVAFDVHTDRLSFIGRDYLRVVEPGEVILSVGHSSEDRPLAVPVELRGPTRLVGEGRVLVTPVTVRDPAG